MELIDRFFEAMGPHICESYIILVILVSYLIKKHLTETLSNFTHIKWLPVYTVLIIATVLAVPYRILEKTSWDVLLISYALATTIHEALLARIEDLLTKPKKKTDEQTP